MKFVAVAFRDALVPKLSTYICDKVLDQGAVISLDGEIHRKIPFLGGPGPVGNACIYTDDR